MTARSGANHRPRGLLIDYGGVLTNALAPVLMGFCRSKGLPDDAVTALQRPDSAFRLQLEAYERGEFEDEDFMPRFAEALGLAAEDMEEFLVEIQPDERMFRAIEALRRRGIRTGLLSNSWSLRLYPRELLASVFDGIVISGEVGMRKPESRIFIHAAGVIGVDPRHCVFVDDTEDHLSAAAQAGMLTVHHREQDGTLAELERLFDVELRSVG